MRIVDFELDYQALKEAKVFATDVRLANRCSLTSIPSRFKIFHRLSDPDLSRPLIMGRFFHELAEKINPASDLGINQGLRYLTNQYLDLSEVYQDRYREFIAEDRSPFKDWSGMSSILDTVNQIFSLQLEEGSRPSREQELVHSNGLLLGKPDAFEIKGSLATITDYKLKYSTKSIDTSIARDQLHFYAMLIRDQSPQISIKLSLIGLNGTFLDVPFDEHEGARIFDSSVMFAERLRELGEKKIPVNDLCQGCQFCAHPELSEQE